MSNWDPRTEYGPDYKDQIEKVKKYAPIVGLGIPLLLVLLIGTLSAVYTVQPEEVAVVKRFGAYSHTSDPGLHFKLPFGVDTVERVPAQQRLLKEEFGFRTTAVGGPSAYSGADFGDESLMLTGDLNIIEVTWVVQYRISDPQKFLFNVREQQQTLRDGSESVMRRIVGNRLGSNVLTVERVEIAANAKDELQDILDSYDSGIEVSTVELQDVVPPQLVQPAFNEVNVSRQERERMINEAEKRRNQQIPRVRGEALQIVAEAEGYATERVNRAHGEVVRFNAIFTEYQAAPDVTRRRLYLEALESVLPKVQSIYVMPDGGSQPLPLLDLTSTNPIRRATQNPTAVQEVNQ